MNKNSCALAMARMNRIGRWLNSVVGWAVKPNIHKQLRDVGLRRVSITYALIALLFFHACPATAENAYEWRTYGSTYFAPLGNQICGSRPSGCFGYAQEWIKKYYPPQDIMFNVVWHFELLNESSPPTFDTENGGFTLAYSYEADYIGTCCGVQGQLLHYRFPSSGSQQWWFWTYAKVWQVEYFVAAERPPNSECGICEVQAPIGHPVNPVTGAVFDAQLDTSSSLGASAFRRFYNSQDAGVSNLSGGWRHAFSRTVVPKNTSTLLKSYTTVIGISSKYVDAATACTNGFAEIRSQVKQWSAAVAGYSNGNCQLTSGGVSIGTLTVYSTANSVTPAAQAVAYNAIRDDGQSIYFTVIKGVITAPPGTALKLTQTASGFTITDGADNVEQYDSNGKLLSITSRAGVVQTMNYDGSGRLSGVSDSFGHQLTFSYDAQGHLLSVTRQ